MTFMAPQTGWRTGWQAGWNTLLGFFYPEICQLCRHEPAAAAAGYVCEPCRSLVRPVRPPFCRRCGLPYDGDLTTEFECTNCRDLGLHFTSARSAVVARTVVLEVIHRFKYQRHLWFEPFLAGLLVAEAGPALRWLGFHHARAVAPPQRAGARIQPGWSAGPPFE